MCSTAASPSCLATGRGTRCARSTWKAHRDGTVIERQLAEHCDTGVVVERGAAGTRVADSWFHDCRVGLLCGKRPIESRTPRSAKPRDHAVVSDRALDLAGNQLDGDVWMRDMAEHLLIALWRAPSVARGGRAPASSTMGAGGAGRRDGRDVHGQPRRARPGPVLARPDAQGLVPNCDALISLGLTRAHDLDDVPARDVLHALARRVEVWRVDRPPSARVGARSWPDGEFAPGVKMVSFMQRADGLTHEQFARHWTENHTPLALRHHVGLWNYTQNVVRRSYTPGGNAIDGVAELHFRTPDDFVYRFFDSDDGRAAILADVAKFMSSPRPETALMRELPLKPTSARIRGGEAEEARFGRWWRRGGRPRAQGGGGGYLLDVRGAVVPVFDADAEMPAAFERGARDRRFEQRAAEHRDGPLHRCVAEHREEEVERLDDRRRAPERIAAAEIAAAREIELHERARGSAPWRAYASTTCRKPGSKIEMLGPRPRVGAHLHLVADLRERVGVHELARGREAVGAGAAEVDRAGVARALAHETQVVEQLHVAVAVGDRLAEADRRVADDPGMLLDDGPERGRVLLGRLLGADHEIGRVRVDDRRARVDARERVLGVLLHGGRHVRIAAAARHAVERDLDHHGRLRIALSLMWVACHAVRTRITELLGIEHPIVQAPMGFIARAQLASAVSNAGGLGIIETSSGQLERGARRDRQDARAHRQAVRRERRAAFIRDASIVDFIAENGVSFVTTSAGDPTKYTKALKDAGITVFHVVPSLRGALKAVDAGVDGLVVEGNEGGGFKAPTGASTMVLLPLIASRVDVPIIAAGGVCDGRSMAAALVLGAEGVQMGTRMVSAAESPVHDNWKKLICTSNEGDTLLLNRNSPPAFRVLRTEFSESAEREARAVIPQLESVRDLYFGGNLEASFAFSGQVAGRITEVLPVAQILNETIAECEAVLREISARYAS